jgi:hypothetical protein
MMNCIKGKYKPIIAYSIQINQTGINNKSRVHDVPVPGIY